MIHQLDSGEQARETKSRRQRVKNPESARAKGARKEKRRETGK